MHIYTALDDLNSSGWPLTSGLAPVNTFSLLFPSLISLSKEANLLQSEKLLVDLQAMFFFLSMITTGVQNIGLSVCLLGFQ